MSLHTQEPISRNTPLRKKMFIFKKEKGLNVSQKKIPQVNWSMFT